MNGFVTALTVMPANVYFRVLSIRKNMEVLTFIPAREHSKRIPGKNLKLFAGKPLLQYTIEQSLASTRINRTIVCTESKKIAAMAKKVGAEVPFLRPQRLATDTSDVIHSVFYFLNRLKKEENYQPTHLLILQATSPLRQEKDITDCFALMARTKATTVLTVVPTHPKLYNMTKSYIKLYFDLSFKYKLLKKPLDFLK